MNDRLSAAEVKESRALDIALAEKMPAILQALPPDIARSVADHVYDSIGTPAWKVPMELILRKKYNWLVQKWHMEKIAA